MTNPTNRPGTPDCPRCGDVMEEGFQLDQASGGSAQARWAAGKPQRSIWVGIKFAQVATGVPITTYRCPKCGLLESYARPLPQPVD